MRLHLRSITLGDFDACWPLSAISRMTPASRERVKRAWQCLLPAGRMQGIVVENLDEPASSAVMGFGVSVFGTDAAARMCHEGHADWIERVWLNLDSLVLDYEGIRRENGGAGLTLIVMQHGWDRSRAGTPAETFVLGDWVTRGFIECHRGFNLRQIFQQMYDSVEAAYVKGGGYRVIHDFPCAREAWGQDGEPRQLLCHVTREEVVGSLSSSISTMFAYTSPVLFLTRGQQELLLLAVEGLPDRAISQRLKVSGEALKKRWRAILERAADHPDFSAMVRGCDGLRLSQRQRLVEYFKLHYEELRPCARSMPATDVS